MGEDTKDIVERICQREMNNKKLNEQPMCVLIGGLPGSGKTNLVEQVKSEHPDRDFLVIDADYYRKLYPRPDELQKSPETAIAKTINFANAIEAELIKKGIEGKFDIISVTSLRATAAIDSIVYEPAINSGYKMEACIMSVPVRECGLSAQNRYETQIEKKEFPRFTPMSFIEGSNSGIIKTILMLQGKRDRPVIKIYKRGKGENSMPIKYYDSTERSSKYRVALEAFMNPETAITPENASSQLKELYEKKENRGADATEYQSLERLEELFGIERDKQVR